MEIRDDLISRAAAIDAIVFNSENKFAVDVLNDVPAVDDTSALYKPRVMTLSGVRNLKEGTPVWLEDIDKKDVIGALFFDDHNPTRSIDFVTVRNRDFKRIKADYEDYGVRWRCWTSCPTDEQRQELKWNDIRENH